MAAVIDTNVLIHGRGNLDFDEIFVVEEVVEEVKSQKGRNVLRNLDYEVEQPSESSAKEVTELSEQLNSPTSETDEKLVALAMEKGEVLDTDDKAMQNLALHLEVGVQGFLDPVLEEKFEWERVCSNCGSEISTLPCSRCGSHQTRLKQVRCS